MITLADYTSYDQIRAALGVAKEELEDETLALDLYAVALELDLEEVDATLISEFTSASEELNPSAAQTRLIDVTKLFSTYSVAKHLLVASTMFAPKDITDGKATVNRVIEPHSPLAKGIESMYEKFKSQVRTALANVATPTSSATPTRVRFVVVAPDVDPVTGA